MRKMMTMLLCSILVTGCIKEEKVKEESPIDKKIEVKEEKTEDMSSFQRPVVTYLKEMKNNDGRRYMDKLNSIRNILTDRMYENISITEETSYGADVEDYGVVTSIDVMDWAISRSDQKTIVYVIYGNKVEIKGKEVSNTRNLFRAAVIKDDGTYKMDAIIEDSRLEAGTFKKN